MPVTEKRSAKETTASPSGFVTLVAPMPRELLRDCYERGQYAQKPFAKTPITKAWKRIFGDL